MKPLHDLIREDQILDLGPLPAPHLAPDATLQQAVQLLVRGRRGAIVVVEDGRPLGIFTERDVLLRVSESAIASRSERSEIPVRDVMSHPPATVRPQETLAEAMEKMAEGSLRHLVIVDSKGGLRGLLNTNDLVQFLTDQYPEQTVNLPPRLRQVYRTPEGG